MGAKSVAEAKAERVRKKEQAAKQVAENEDQENARNCRRGNEPPRRKNKELERRNM